MKLEISDIVREDFNKWYCDDYLKIIDNDSGWYEANKLREIADFYQLPFEMQVGVLIAYCDSKENILEVFTNLDWTEQCHEIEEWKWEIHYGDFEGAIYSDEIFKTRQEAQISALNQTFKLIEKEL